MEIYKPDFKQVYAVANELLLCASSIKTFPYSVTRMIEEMTDINCCSFKRALSYGVDIRKFGSESAVIVDYGGRCIIFYNDSQIDTRIRFSLLHELGHYILNHEKDVKDVDLYKKQEVEANSFAAQLLMPKQIIAEIQHRGKRVDENFLIKYFNVSKEAAIKRMESAYKFNSGYSIGKNIDEWIILKYNIFIDYIIPKSKSIDWFEDEYERQRNRDKWL